MKKITRKSQSYYPYDFDNNPQPEQLVYLAISVAAVMVAFIALILI